MAGGFNLAWNVAVVPPIKLNPIITRVLFPAFAKIQDDSEKLRVNFYKLLSVVGIINFPALLGLMVVSDNVVPLVFGEVERHYSGPATIVHCGFAALGGESNRIALDGESPGRYQLQIQCVQNHSVYSCHFHWRSSGRGRLA